MKNYFEEIEKKLRMQIKFESLEIVDNSHKHKGHKFFSAEKFHLHLKIKLNFSFFAYLINDFATCLTNFSFSNRHGPDIKVSLSVSFFINCLDKKTDLGIFIN